MSPQAATEVERPITNASTPPAYSSLVNRIIDGDAAAEAELVALFKDRIVHIILRIANNTSMVEDFSQDTFCTVIRKIRNGDLKQPESLGFFVASVARNHAIEQMRGLRRRATEDLEHAEQVPDPSPNPLEQLQASEKFDEIREVIQQLRPRYRELLLRFYINEESKESICADLGMTSEQFDGVVHRARKRFKALYLKRKDLSERGGRG
jgi:RNA polymerase sigma-70 factor (ECF subfamily)